MKNFLAKYWPILILLALSILIVWPLFLPGYFSHHDNIQTIRIFEMRRCFEDGQIPCRWVPDMGYGYGFPLFNYYGVFPYYLGGFFSLFLGYIGAAKALFFIPLILGGISMYYLSKELFGSKLVGFLSGVLYLFAPYRALDAYVRGAIAESFALAIIPLVFYFSLKLIKNNSAHYFFATTFSLGVFLTNHNIMTLFFMPLLLVWVIYHLVEQKSKNVTQVIFSIGLGIGISSFYFIPAYFEKNLVQIQNLLESEYIPNFRAHFVTLRQLFTDRFWGYGASTWGERDGISFQVGWPHWWLTAIITFFGFLKLIAKINILPEKINVIISVLSNKLTWSQAKLVIILFSIFTIYLLMTHNKSAFIWEAVETLQFSQFPWRFLSVVIFAVSLLGGLVILLFKQRWQLPILILVTLVTVILNWQLFRPEKFFYSQTDETLLSGEDWDFQRKGAIVDYLPLLAKEPKQPASFNPEVLSGEAEAKNFVNRSNYWKFKIHAFDNTLVEVPVFDFPNWQVYINNKKVEHSLTEVLGTILVKVNPGEYIVEGKFENTSIRTLSNLLTLVSFITLLYFVTYGKNKFRKL